MENLVTNFNYRYSDKQGWVQVQMVVLEYKYKYISQVQVLLHLACILLESKYKYFLEYLSPSTSTINKEFHFKLNFIFKMYREILGCPKYLVVRNTCTIHVPRHNTCAALDDR